MVKFRFMSVRIYSILYVFEGPRKYRRVFLSLEHAYQDEHAHLSHYNYFLCHCTFLMVQAFNCLSIRHRACVCVCVCVCIRPVTGGIQMLLLHSTSHPIHHLLVQPPYSPPGELQPLRGLTKILRALTFAGHLAHPHQSVEVALCSVCDTWKHGSIGHQIKGAELKCLLQLCTPPLQPPQRGKVGHGK